MSENREEVVNGEKLLIFTGIYGPFVSWTINFVPKRLDSNRDKQNITLEITILLQYL